MRPRRLLPFPRRILVCPLILGYFQREALQAVQFGFFPYFLWKKGTAPVARREIARMSKPKKAPAPPASQPAAEVRSPRTSILYSLAGAFIIAAAAFVVYLPSLNGDFILDDHLLISNNDLVKSSDGLSKIWFTTKAVDYWPMTNSSFWIEWRLWRNHTTGYHVTNLILHVTSSFLIWIILRRLSIPGAFLAALLFAVHPVNVESVASICQRKNTLSLFFCLLSILWYLKSGLFAQPSALHPRWYWLSLLAFLLAMLSKGSVAVLPVLLLGIVWWRRKITWNDLVHTAPFFLISLVLTVVNLYFQSQLLVPVMETAGPLQRVLGAGKMVWFYLFKALWPLNLAFIYPQWTIDAGRAWEWLPLLACLFVTALLWMYRKGWSRPLLFAWGFFCVSLVPVLGFANVGFMKYCWVADRYQYLAIIAVVSLAAAGWGALLWESSRTVRRTALIAAVALVGFFGALTWRQSGKYCNAITLYQDTLQKNPDCWLIHNLLGGLLLEAGQIPEALGHIETALRLNPDYAPTHNNLGNILFRANRLSDAIAQYRLALKLDQDLPEAQLNLAIALMQTGRLPDALKHAYLAIRLNPNYAEAYNALGIALAKTGQWEKAIAQYRSAIKIRPDYAEAYNDLGNALFEEDSLPEAIDAFRRALRFDPGLADAHYNLGLALDKSGLSSEAIEQFHETLTIKHDYYPAMNNLGNVLLKENQLDQAISWYRQALKSKPDYPEALFNLGNALNKAHRVREAIPHYEEAVRIKPDYIEAYANLASSYADVGLMSEALVAGKKALELARFAHRSDLAQKIERWLANQQTRPAIESKK
jgi:protein O-mannosyl-transferase